MTVNRLSRPVVTLWLLYALFIVYGTTIPFHFDSGTVRFVDKLRGVPLSPFVVADTGRRLSIPDVVQNILLFVPFGALGFLVRRPDRWQKALMRIAGITVLGALLSTAVEASQLLTTDRVASTADVMTNTIGGFLGAFAAWLLQTAFVRGFRRLREEGLAVAELRPLVVSSIVLAIAAWQPFDATLDVGSFSLKLRGLQGDVWQFGGLRDEGMSLMIAIFFATTLASYISVLGETHAGIKAFVGGTVVVCLLEASQIVIGSRMPGLWDVMIATAGVGIGAALWTAASRVIRPTMWLTVFVVMTAMASGLENLSPFTISESFHTVGWFPFLGYYANTTFDALSHVIELGLLYFPLGYWLSTARPNRRSALLLALLLTLLIAGPIEYLQGWVVGRFPDITDVALSLAGVVAGVYSYNSQLRET